MDGNGDESVVLATLSDGAHVVSTLIIDNMPPRHVYRVLRRSGSVEREFTTLSELNSNLATRTPEAPEAPEGR